MYPLSLYAIDGTVESCDPGRRRGQVDLPRRPSRRPPVPAAARMDARRRDHHAAARLDLASGRDRRRRERIVGAEPQVPPTTTRLGLDRRRGHSPLFLDRVQRAIATGARVDVEDDEMRDRSGHHADVRVGPASPPRRHLRRARRCRLEPLPPHARVLGRRRAGEPPARAHAAAHRVHGNHRPSELAIRERRGRGLSRHLNRLPDGHGARAGSWCPR